MSSLFTALDEGDTEQTGEEISGRAMSHAAALVRIFGECREGGIFHSLLCLQAMMSVACCGIFHIQDKFTPTMNRAGEQTV